LEEKIETLTKEKEKKESKIQGKYEGQIKDRNTRQFKYKEEATTQEREKKASLENLEAIKSAKLSHEV